MNHYQDVYKHKWAPVDYCLLAGILLVVCVVSKCFYIEYKYQEPCAQTCAPQNSSPSGEIFGSDVSCICDLTKERIEVP